MSAKTVVVVTTLSGVRPRRTGRDGGRGCDRTAPHGRERRRPRATTTPAARRATESQRAVARDDALSWHGLGRAGQASASSGPGSAGRARRARADACRSGSRSAARSPRTRLGDAAVVDLGRPAAARADHVVVMGRRARDVGVLAVRQVEPLDDAELREQVERPEQGRPADPERADPAPRPRARPP